MHGSNNYFSLQVLGNTVHVKASNKGPKKGKHYSISSSLIPKPNSSITTKFFHFHNASFIFIFFFFFSFRLLINSSSDFQIRAIALDKLIA